MDGGGDSGSDRSGDELLAAPMADEDGLWRFFAATLPEAPAPSAPPLGGNEDPVIESAALLELAGFVDHPELPSDYNLSWFFKWLAGQHGTRATVFAKGITVTMHRLDGTAQPIQVRVGEETVTLRVVACRNVPCERCRSGAGGYRFQLRGPWVCSAWRPGMSPVAARRAWAQCGACAACMPGHPGPRPSTEAALARTTAVAGAWETALAATSLETRSALLQAGIDATSEGAERFGSLWREMLAKRLGLEWRSAPSGRDLLGDCVNARPSHLRPSDLADRVWKELDLLSAASTSSPPLALLLRTATRKTPAADATACTEPGQQPASSPSAAVPWDDGDFDQDPLVTVGNRLLAHVPVDPWADRSIVGLDDGVPAASLADADIFPREPLAAMVLSPAAPSTASRPP